MRFLLSNVGRINNYEFKWDQGLDGSIRPIKFEYTKWTKIGVSVVAAGAVGNMIDRIFRGFVVDMIDFNGLWHFVFNVADMYVHIGIYIIVIDYLARKYMEKNRK